MNMQLEAFDDRHGEVVLNALAVYAERMRETATEAQAASQAPELSPEPPGMNADGTATIRLTPTPGGFAHMARMFGEAADKADKARSAYEALTGRDDDEDDENPGPHEADGFVSVGTGPGGRIDYEVRLEGVFKDRFPTGDIAIYELARAMDETGSFPNAWMEGEHGPSSRSIDDEVRAFHDAGGGGLLPLPGARFAPGDNVIDSDDGWPCTVIRDYGDLGVHVRAQGDPDVTAVVPPARLTQIPEPVQTDDAEGTERELAEASRCVHQTGYGLPWMEYCGIPLPYPLHPEG